MIWPPCAFRSSRATETLTVKTGIPALVRAVAIAPRHPRAPAPAPAHVQRPGRPAIAVPWVLRGGGNPPRNLFFFSACVPLLFLYILHPPHLPVFALPAHLIAPRPSWPDASRGSC